MKKITELVAIKTRTKESRDINGRLVREQVEYVGPARIEYPTPGSRYLHVFLDNIAFQLLLFLAAILFASSEVEESEASSASELLASVFYLLLYVGYYALFEGLFQRSPAKFITRCKVVDEFGKKPAFKQIVIRSFTRIVPFEVFSFFNDETRGWHDKWSKTYVLKESQIEALNRMQSDSLNRADSND